MITMSFSLLSLASTFTPSNTKPLFKTRTNQTQGFKVSCNSAPHDHNDNQLILPEFQKLVVPSVDRRNLLLGLGGLSAASLTSLPTALADVDTIKPPGNAFKCKKPGEVPIETPDITFKCKESSAGFPDIDHAIRTRKCCPPNIGKSVKDYVIPKENTVRMRWPAHKGTAKQVDDYRRAIQAMKDLPEDDPRSFISQAKIHCAYCNGGYNQLNPDGSDSDVPLQIHNSWLFFPFHRWYLYFYERILGKLINEPEFALPFWEWDNPAGMPIPEMFLHNTCINGKPNPLYDVYRDEASVKEGIVDLAFIGVDKHRSKEEQIKCNLITVYRDLVRNAGDTLSFFGGEYVTGSQPVPNGDDSVGSVEAGSHTAVHRWVGNSKLPNNEDMGNFYSAGYDPLFYIHHSNVDRTWKLWKDLRLPGHVDPIGCKSWANASYVFYDENQELVRVYNKDCVDLKTLNYNYIDSFVEPWRTSSPPKRSLSAQVASREIVQTVEESTFPVSLDKILMFRVRRPAVNRTKEEMDRENEVLMINGVKFDCGKFVKFDVFVNDKVSKSGDLPTPCDPEYAGSFTQIPHGDGITMPMTSAARFGLNELLEDTNSEGEEYATVVVVPKTGCEDLTIGEITIKLVPRLQPEPLVS